MNLVSARLPALLLSHRPIAIPHRCFSNTRTSHIALTSLSIYQRRKPPARRVRMQTPVLHADARESHDGEKSMKTKPKRSPKFRAREGEIATSKAVSWVLRHGAKEQGLYMRPDGYVRVNDLLSIPRLRSLSFQQLEDIVAKDSKKRYNLSFEPDLNSTSNIWWIRANQGHSIGSVKLDLQEITSASEIPMAVHGTTKKAWESISAQGLSKMKRNHIHLAQGVAGDSVVSGMRRSSQILIFVDVAKALSAGIKFFLSDNGVVLTEGNSEGFLSPQFFKRVETADRVALKGWQGPRDHNGQEVRELPDKPIISSVSISDNVKLSQTSKELAAEEYN